MKKILFLLIIPIVCYSQIDDKNIRNINSYYLNVSEIESNMYKINETNYYLKTKKCLEEGYSRNVKLTFMDDKITLCFLNKQNQEMGVLFNESYTDCYKIIKTYESIDVNKIIQLESKGFKKAELLLKESALNRRVLNSINITH